MRALAPALAAVLTLAGVTVAGAPPSASASSPSCGGVMVVVDPGPLGGEVRESCADDAGGTAAEVMASAGITFTYTEGQPFVCRIDGLPGPDREDCRGTPPGDAYWGLFWSGGSTEGWRYSSLGLAALDIPAGGAVGWRFQDGSEREEPRGGTTVPTSTETERASTATPDDSDDDVTLTWLAGGAVLLLAGAGGVLALRRRDRPS